MKNTLNFILILATFCAMNLVSKAGANTIIHPIEPIQPLPVEMGGVNVKKANLGQQLFNDVCFSQNNSISCVSCHNFRIVGGQNV